MGIIEFVSINVSNWGISDILYIIYVRLNIG